MNKAFQSKNSVPAGNVRDKVLSLLLRGCVAISAGIIFVIIIFVARESLPAIREIGFGPLFTDESWNPLGSNYNMVPMIVGTLAAAFGSLFLTVPLGLGTALCIRFYSFPVTAWLLRRCVEILAGIPSVVYGLLGMSVIVPAIAAWSPIGQGQSLLAGILILSIMTFPTITVAADAAIGAVPKNLTQAAAALGLSKRAIIWSVIFPAARRGILSGVILQVGRALGETMAVLMVCGNVVRFPKSFFQPVRTLTANIALEMGYADELHRSLLFVSGLILLVVVIAVMFLAQWGDRQRENGGGKEFAK